MTMVYFAVCIFISAFLLFQVEPIIARYILPWFGGTPAVWSTVMLFFQVLLTSGYAYARWLVDQKHRKEIFHLVLLLFSLGLMLELSLTWKSPITPTADWKPHGDFSPIWEIFKLLTISVGLPFFLLASNSTLIQTWFDRTYPGRSTYRLYALSNTGSLIALITYPVLIEPYLTIPWQGRVWSMTYVIFAGLSAFGTIKVMRTRIKRGPTPEQTAIKNPEQSPKRRKYFLWIALSTCASVLLLATTSQITQEVAVIPFLWVLPLAIYLLTFILAFGGERWYSRQVYLIMFFGVTLLYSWALNMAGLMAIPMQIGIFSLALFISCMICNGELYRLRPHPDYLTTFYLMVSLGGALGGILVNFVAPYLFKGYWELPLGYTLCCLLFLMVFFFTKNINRSHLAFVINSSLLISAFLISGTRTFQSIHSDLGDSLGIWRNYYGVIRVKEIYLPSSNLHYYVLVHGITVHGEQFLDEEWRDIPTAYYGETGGGGLAILNHPRRDLGMRVGVLGLGIGTLSTYGQPGDIYRFYEINPVVIRLAEGEGGYFHYLKDSLAKVEVVLGDARLSLEKELAAGQPQHFDILALDVFSSDSIPVHLLDEESFALYLNHLAPDGILAVHITNRYLDLVPVVWTLANHFSLSRVLIDDPGNGITTSHSIWMLLAREPVFLSAPSIQSRATPMEDYIPKIRLWTDDFSNLFQILVH